MTDWGRSLSQKDFIFKSVSESEAYSADTKIMLHSMVKYCVLNFGERKRGALQVQKKAQKIDFQ